MLEEAIQPYPNVTEDEKPKNSSMIMVGAGDPRGDGWSKVIYDSTVTALENTDSTTLVTCSIENCDEQFAVPIDQAQKAWVCPPHNQQALEAEQMSPQQIAKKLQQADLRPRTFWDPFGSRGAGKGRNGTYVKPKTDQPKGKKAVRAAKRARAAALKAQEGR